MTCHLLDLQNELQLMILEELLYEEYTEERGEDAEGVKRSECSLCRDEDAQERPSAKSQRDLLSWSCTSRRFRDFIAPYIFKSVKLCNDNKSGRSLGVLARSNHNLLIKELHFIGSALGDDEISNIDYFDVNSILPDSVSELLSDLRCFPGLEKLSIKFDYHSLHWRHYDFHALGETDEQVREAEEDKAWRALMRNTYEALLRNKEIHWKTFKLKHLASIKVSTFSSPAFHQFLSQFEAFSVSNYSCNLYDAYSFRELQEYQRTTSELDKLLFDHLGNVTTLSIKTSGWGLIGAEFSSQGTHTALKDYHVPLLKAVYLEYISITKELVDFLVCRAKTLEKVSLCHCYGTHGANRLNWKHLFDSFHAANPEKLRVFEILLDNRHGQKVTVVEEELSSSKPREASQILDANPNAHVFPYARIHSEYDGMWVDEDQNVASCKKGEDRASYEKLMRKVDVNTARGILRVD
ncbi:hypothetical protein MMC21_008432 [Puttea exsequens]|nr:hypothetical protein [Puttea exsequens]